MFFRLNFGQCFKKFVISLGVSLTCYAQLVFAQSVCPPDPVTPTPKVLQAWFRDAPERGFLWEIEKNGRKSWLFGTIHTAKPHWVGLGPKTLSSLRAADIVALEIDPIDVESMTDMQSQIEVLARADRANPLPSALQNRLAMTAANNCVSADVIKTLPISFAVITTILNGSRKDGLEPAFGIDVFLAGFARGAKKPVVALETNATQMGVISGLFGDDRDSAVAQALDGLDSGETRTQLLKLANLWESADHEALRNYLLWCDCVKTEKDARVMAQINDARNPAIADGIDAIHSSGRSVFAAVGSLHFTGPKAIQDLLASKGYSVKVAK